MGEGPRVCLVGAGPGDPDLLTVRAMRLIANAEVVIYDRLVSDEIMALVPAGVPRISVGKRPKNHPVPQREINDILLALARTGKRVVRLKGGDPFLFGRGGEEALALKAHGIHVEVVPGVTAAQACAAAAGVPLTHRGLATGVRYVTGHARDDADLDLDWDGLADPDTTLVVYMGLATIRRIAEQLMCRGLSSATPAMAINNGTTPRQRCVTSTLGRIAETAHAQDFDGPVLFVIGRVVELAHVLGEPTGVEEGHAAAAFMRAG